MVTETKHVAVFIGTYVNYDEDDFQAGGAVEINCSCDYSGFCEVDDDGKNIHGECPECLTSFDHPV